MKVGDYVRTDDGKIINIQVLQIIKDINCDYVEINYEKILRNNIVKSSPNIIDLIEVGDYVNGCYVDEIIGANDSWDDRQHFHLLKFNSYFGNSDIKSIVTKEQFSSMEYKAGE